MKTTTGSIVERVGVLPFHQMGRFKWEKLGLDYRLENTKTPSGELIEEGLTAY